MRIDHNPRRCAAVPATPNACDMFSDMDEYSIGTPRDAEARRLGQDAARSFFTDPVEGDTMESFVVGDVTGEIVRLTRAFQQSKQGEVKSWRRRHFIGPIALSLAGIVMSIATTPRPGSGGSSIPAVIGVLGLVGGCVWLIVNAFRASARLADAQQVREVETGRLLEIARGAASATYLELGRADGTAGRPKAAAEAPAADAPEPDYGATPQPTVDDDDAALDRARQQRRAAASPPPPGQPFGVSQGGAEYLVAAWMRHLGESDAGTSHETGVGRVAAASARYVAQVANDDAPVGLEAVQELVAAAAVDGRRALFFTAGSFAEDAEAFAEKSGVALLVYDAIAGTLDGANELGRAAVLDGLK
jgi:hypothetical protein